MAMRDDDKLVRQLSLVAFLMSQQRPVTADEIHESVEGYGPVVTARQRDAIRWLEAHEPASQFQVRKAGFKLRTFEVLAREGLIEARTVNGRVRPFHVYSTHGSQLQITAAA